MVDGAISIVLQSVLVVVSSCRLYARGGVSVSVGSRDRVYLEHTNHIKIKINKRKKLKEPCTPPERSSQSFPFNDNSVISDFAYF